jgi:hypothetical protein
MGNPALGLLIYEKLSVAQAKVLFVTFGVHRHQAWRAWDRTTVAATT